ncbi:MAG: hypothetical protein ACLQF2_15585 [Rhodomicrobium sp.]
MPKIRMGSLLVAYQEGDHIVAVQLDNRFFDPCGVYYLAQLRGSIQSHITSAFSPVEVKRTKYLPGEYEEGVWRPGLGKDTFSEVSRDIVRADKQSLFLLIAKMNDLLLTVEPTSVGLKCHGARIRELHLLACMEVENYLRLYLEKGMGSNAPSRPTTKNYFPLKERLHLGEYGVHFAQYQTLKDVRPFSHWQLINTTKSLTWYNDYNYSKHNRREAGHRSTLLAAVHATAGALILFVVQHGLRELFDSNDQLSAQIRNALYINLHRLNFSSVYVPRLAHADAKEGPATLHVESIHAWRQKAFVL